MQGRQVIDAIPSECAIVCIMRPALLHTVALNIGHGPLAQLVNTAHPNHMPNPKRNLNPNPNPNPNVTGKSLALTLKRTLASTLAQP